MWSTNTKRVGRLADAAARLALALAANLTLSEDTSTGGR